MKRLFIVTFAVLILGALPVWAQEAWVYHAYLFQPMQGAVPFTLEATRLQEKVSAAELEGSYGFYVNTPPKGLEGVGSIELKTTRNGSKRSLLVKPQASVFAQNKFYSATRVTLKDKNLSLETVALRGVSYQFDGAFHKKSFSGVPVMFLKGHLIKKLNGKIVAEGDVDLQYETGED